MSKVLDMGEHTQNSKYRDPIVMLKDAIEMMGDGGAWEGRKKAIVITLVMMRVEGSLWGLTTLVLVGRRLLLR